MKKIRLKIKNNKYQEKDININKFRKINLYKFNSK